MHAQTNRQTNRQTDKHIHTKLHIVYMCMYMYVYIDINKHAYVKKTSVCICINVSMHAGMHAYMLYACLQILSVCLYT